MDKLKIRLENCYGIKKLDHDFDFSRQNRFAIYAANGAMKSSFAQVFQDIADGNPSRDRIFPSRTSTRMVSDEADAALPPETVLVIRPYDEVFGHSEKTSTLLVDATLRQEYEQLQREIEKAKSALLKALKAQSSSKRSVDALEADVSLAFTKNAGDFYRALVRVKDEVESQNDAPLADVKYDLIFDEKVVAFLATKEVQAALQDYIEKYNELLDASTYFRRGTFTYYNASNVAKALAENGFFDAKHTVSLNADQKLEIATEKQLEQLISAEKEQISSDRDLRKRFNDVEKLIQKNVSLRNFERYVSERPELLPALLKLEQFKEDVWKSYFKSNYALYLDVVDKYQAAERRRREIEQIASTQRTQWERVIDIFNDRFFVPFELVPKNRVSVILGEEKILTLGFTFKDGTDEADVRREDLLQALSTGEKKALYVLNVIFEIEVRKRAGQQTLVVVDDIADSFDYRNKYAIVQYLKDIADDSSFKIILLTHNFDFFRTVNLRFVPYNHCLMALKSSDGVELRQATGIQNVFVKDWKLHLFDDVKKRIASIPFVRNIVEYTKGDTDQAFMLLTSLLHWKPDSAGITQADLDQVYAATFGTNAGWRDPSGAVVDSIIAAAKDCLAAGAGINFENKIVLSIAIRLEAERYMVSKIRDSEFVNAIDGNQTSRLFGKYRDDFPGDSNGLEVLQRVVLMTPENIHLNSFMYEPILDMSDEHLRKLFVDVLSLK